MANTQKKKAKTIVAFILLVIGLIWIIFCFIGFYLAGSAWPLLVVPLFIGVIPFVIGLVLLPGKKSLFKQVEPLTE